MTSCYQFTPYAAVCVDSHNDLPIDTSERLSWTTLWSVRGFTSSKGRCVAIRANTKGVVQVLVVKDGLRRWFAIDRVLTTEQMDYWSCRDEFRY